MRLGLLGGWVWGMGALRSGFARLLYVLVRVARIHDLRPSQVLAASGKYMHVDDLVWEVEDGDSLFPIHPPNRFPPTVP